MTTPLKMSLRTTSRQIWQLLEPVHHMLAPIVFGIILIESLILSQPYLLKQIVDLLTHFSARQIPTLLTLIIGWYVLSNVISLLINFWNQPMIFEHLLVLERELPLLAHRRLVGLHYGFHESQETGKTITRVEKGTQRLVDLMANMMFEFLPTLMKTIGTTTMMFLVDWRIALIFVPANPIFIWLTILINRRIQPLRHERHQGYEEAGALFGDTMINIATVIGFAQEKRETSRLAAIRQHIYQVERQEWRTILHMDFLRGGVINVSRTLILFVSVYLLTRGQISIGSVVLFVTMSETAYFSLYRMSRLFDRAAEWSHGISRFCRLLEVVPEVTEKPNAIAAPRFHGRITFDHVTFRYGHGRKVLKDVSFCIEPGQTVAMVGRSGCGKSTIVKLLSRFYDPTSGHVTIDGQQSDIFTHASLRSQIAVVSQDAPALNLSVRANIAYGRPDATDEEVIAAAKTASAHGFIMNELPQGYDTIVGERGVKLSGGQRQRLAIARAVLVDPPVLVFDEATSHLDSEFEQMIQSALAVVGRGRTVIIVAHRLSTICAADKILVFRHGQLIEQGTHPHLLQLDGHYAHLWHLQHPKT